MEQAERSAYQALRDANHQLALAQDELRRLCSPLLTFHARDRM